MLQVKIRQGKGPGPWRHASPLHFPIFNLIRSQFLKETYIRTYKVGILVWDIALISGMYIFLKNHFWINFFLPETFLKVLFANLQNMNGFLRGKKRSVWVNNIKRIKKNFAIRCSIFFYSLDHQIFATYSNFRISLSLQTFDISKLDDLIKQSQNLIYKRSTISGWKDLGINLLQNLCQHDFSWVKI